MLHPLAQTEIDKLRAHGVEALTYDEVAALHERALEVERAAASEGLPTGLTRPVRLGPGADQTLWPMTCAAMDALARVEPWVGDDEAEAARAVGWLLAHGRDLPLLERATLTRADFAAAVRDWARRLPVTAEELAAAVRATFAAGDDAGFRVEAEAFERVARHAEAAGEPDTAAAVRDLLARLQATRRKTISPHRARPAWGAMTLRLAALTGCPPDAWRVQPAPEAIDAYAALFDFEALKAGADGAEPAKRAQRDALRALFAATDAIARAHVGGKFGGLDA